MFPFDLVYYHGHFDLEGFLILLVLGPVFVLCCLKVLVELFAPASWHKERNDKEQYLRDCEDKWDGEHR